MLRIAVAGSLAVILLETFDSVASSRFGVPYSSLAIISLLIYVCVGIATGPWAVRTRHNAALFGIAGGAIVGLVDATIGWGIFFATIGPGRPPPGATPGFIAFATAFAVLSGAVLALLGSVTAAAIYRGPRS